MGWLDFPRSGLYKFQICAAGDGSVTSYLGVLSRVSGKTLLFMSTADKANLQYACTRTPIGCRLVDASLTTEGQANPTIPGAFDLNCVSTVVLLES